MFKKNIRISDHELALLERVNTLGPCSSEKIHESMDPRPEYLLVMRALHGLVAKGFLQRVIINQKQFYKTSKHYSLLKSFLNNPEA